MRTHYIIAVVIMLLLALQLQGCGRKGPLYLQQKPAAPAQPSSSQAVLPVSQPAVAQPAQSAVLQSPTIQNATDTKE